MTAPLSSIATNVEAKPPFEALDAVQIRIDGETARLADQKLANQIQRSNAEDLDMTEAISKFQSMQTGYDAALKSYSMVQRLSLFEYLRT